MARGLRGIRKGEAGCTRKRTAGDVRDFCGELPFSRLGSNWERIKDFLFGSSGFRQACIMEQ